MKKFIKNLAKALSLIMVIAFAVMPFTACSDKNANKSTNQPVLENTTDINNAEESAENVTDSDNTSDDSTEETEEIVLSGIYQIAWKITYKDTWYENEEEVIEFFQTRDINGVYNALRKLGYEEYMNHIIETETITLETMLYFNNGRMTGIYKEVGTNKFYNSGITFNISDVINNIESDENGTIYIYVQYSYYDEETSTFVDTPIYTKMPLKLIEQTEQVLTGTIFNYKEDSSKLTITSDTTSSIEKLPEIFGIDEEVEDKFSAIVEKLSGWKIMMTNDQKTITILVNEYEFSYINLTEGTYTIDNITFSLEKRVVELDSSTQTLYFTITVEESAIFSFEFVNK